MKSNTYLLLATIFLAQGTVFAAPAESPALIEKGKSSFKMNCTICHGDNGDGNGPAGAVMKPKPRNFKTDDFKGADGKGKFAKPTKEQIYAVIKSGVKGTSMAGYGHLSEDDKWGLTYYILQMRNKK